jgi:plasmid replication initiation protein
VRNRKENILTAQSNQMTMSKLSVTSAYQKRILYAVVDTLSPHIMSKMEETKGKKIGKEFALDMGLYRDIAVISYKIHDLDPNRNYKRVREALLDLRKKNVSVELRDGRHLDTGLLLRSVGDEKNGSVELWVDVLLFQFLADLSRGATMFQMKVAMSFSSIYAMKLYEYIAMQRKFTYFEMTLETFRFTMNVEKMYSDTKDLKKRVLDIAIQQINDSEITDIKVKYVDLKKGKKVTGFGFYLEKTGYAHEQTQLANKVSLHWDFTKDLIENFAKYNLIIKGKNLDLVKSLKAEVGEQKLAAEMESIHEKAKLMKNPQGYMIASLKKYLENSKKEANDFTPAERKKHAENARKGDTEGMPKSIGDLFSNLKKP